MLMCVCMLSSFSCVQLFVTLWTDSAKLLCLWHSPGKILEWVAMPSSRGSSQPRDQTQVSCIEASLIVQLVKNWPAMLETPVQFLGGEDQLQKG